VDGMGMVRVGVIGTGFGMPQVRAFGAHPRATVTAVCSRDAGMPPAWPPSSGSLTPSATCQHCWLRRRSTRWPSSLPPRSTRRWPSRRLRPVSTSCVPSHRPVGRKKPIRLTPCEGRRGAGRPRPGARRPERADRSRPAAAGRREAAAPTRGSDSRLETPLLEVRPASGPIRARPVLGGLHHSYERAAWSCGDFCTLTGAPEHLAGDPHPHRAPPGAGRDDEADRALPRAGQGPTAPRAGAEVHRHRSAPARGDRVRPGRPPRVHRVAPAHRAGAGERGPTRPSVCHCHYCHHLQLARRGCRARRPTGRRPWPWQHRRRFKLHPLASKR